MYYVTICINNKNRLLGKIEDEKFVLNEAGKMIECQLQNIENKFQNVYVDYFIIMPDHIHVIIEKSNVDTVGHEDPTLPEILQWYKSITTHEYLKGVKEGIFQPYYKKLWQKSYYEHVIRNERELEEIRKYIQDNPIKECINDA